MALLRKKRTENSRRDLVYSQIRELAFKRGPEAKLPTLTELQTAYGASQATVSGYLSGGTLTAHLSDGSAADFVGTASGTTQAYRQLFTLVYNAASSGKTLTVTWEMTSGTENITLQSAALRSP